MKWFDSPARVFFTYLAATIGLGILVMVVFL